MVGMSPYGSSGYWSEIESRVKAILRNYTQPLKMQVAEIGVGLDGKPAVRMIHPADDPLHPRPMWTLIGTVQVGQWRTCLFNESGGMVFGDIPTGSSGGGGEPAPAYYQSVQEVGVNRTQRAILNFLNGFDITDQPVDGTTNVSIDLSELEHNDLGGKSTGDPHPQYALDQDLSLHLDDTTGAHPASAISVLDTANRFTATDVEGVLSEIMSSAAYSPLNKVPLSNQSMPAITFGNDPAAAAWNSTYTYWGQKITPLVADIDLHGFTLLNSVSGVSYTVRLKNNTTLADIATATGIGTGGSLRINFNTPVPLTANTKYEIGVSTSSGSNIRITQTASKFGDGDSNIAVDANLRYVNADESGTTAGTVATTYRLNAKMHYAIGEVPVKGVLGPLDVVDLPDHDHEQNMIVINNTANPMLLGHAVKVAGEALDAAGVSRPSVILAGGSDAAMPVTGLLAEAIPVGGIGKMVTEGIVRDIPSNLTPGAKYYAGDNPGSYSTSRGSFGDLLQIVGTAISSSSFYVSLREYTRLTHRGRGTSTVTSTVTTLADIPIMTLGVEAGVTYSFKAMILYNVAAATTGARFTVNGPAMTRISYITQMPSVTAGAAAMTVSMYNALLLPAAATTGSPYTTSNLCVIEGICTPSASGTLAIRFATEIAGSAVQVQPGSTWEIWVL